MRIQQINYALNLSQVLIWQYDKATNLLGLTAQKQAWYDINQSGFWQNWYDNVFNLQTANLFGLAVWSYILNVPLYVPVAPEPSIAKIWGFNEITVPGSPPTLLNSYLNFGQSAVAIYTCTLNGTTTITLTDTTGLSNGLKVIGTGIPLGTTIVSFVPNTSVLLSQAATESITTDLAFTTNTGGNFARITNALTEEEQRFLLRLRYFQLYTRGNIQDSNAQYAPISGINNFLNYLCATSDINYAGTIYALDNLNMTMTYVFTAPNFNPNLLTAIQTLDIFPRPAGVLLDYTVL